MPEDLFNETPYYLEIKPHKADYNMAEKTEHELYHIVPYGFNIIHTVKRRCFVRIDAEYVCNHKEIKYEYPHPSLCLVEMLDGKTNKRADGLSRMVLRFKVTK